MFLKHTMKSGRHPRVTCPALQGEALFQVPHCKVTTILTEGFVWGYSPFRFLFLIGSEEFLLLFKLQVLKENKRNLLKRDYFTPSKGLYTVYYSEAYVQIATNNF